MEQDAGGPIRHFPCLFLPHESLKKSSDTDLYSFGTTKSKQ
ncbi:hypothetical protein SDJN02_09911, partial [Cucurbita argyrosperma subsp. argyrosperma]